MDQLIIVAYRNTTVTLFQEVLIQSVASIFATIHDSVSQFSRTMLLEMKRHNYVTPTNFLELVTGYKQ